MHKKTKFTLGEHKTNKGCFGLFEEQKTKLDLLREKLAIGEVELIQGEGIDGDDFMQQLVLGEFSTPPISEHS